VTARVVPGWAHSGVDALVLENAALRVTVLAEFGGHIFELIDKAAGRNLLVQSADRAASRSVRSKLRRLVVGWLGRDLPDR
jgi:hypothetical protein